MSTDYRVLREAAGFDFPFSLIKRVWDELLTPYEPDDRLSDLTAGQRAAYSLYWIFAEVCNGGFDQCFSNSTGSLMLDAIEGARLFSADGWEEALSTAAGVLGEPYPQGRDDRNRRLDALTEAQQEILSACDDRLYELDRDPATSLTTLISAYAEVHPSEFYVAAPTEAAAAQALLDTARAAINAPFGRDLDLAERLLIQARSRAVEVGEDTIVALAQSLLDQLPSLRC